MNDWIECDGKTCPVADGTKIDIRFRDGQELLRQLNKPSIRWEHLGYKKDITHVRIVEPAPIVRLFDPAHTIDNVPAPFQHVSDAAWAPHERMGFGARQISEMWHKTHGLVLRTVAEWEAQCAVAIPVLDNRDAEIERLKKESEKLYELHGKQRDVIEELREQIEQLKEVSANVGEFSASHDVTRAAHAKHTDAELKHFLERLASQQEPLGAAFRRVLEENLWKLYEREKPRTNSVLARAPEFDVRLGGGNQWMKTR